MVHRVTKSQRGLKSLSSHTYIWCVIIIESESVSLSVPCDSVVSRSWLTLCNPMDYSPSGSSVRGILQASILEWGAMPFSRGSSQFRDRTRVFLIQADSVPSETLISNILFQRSQDIHVQKQSSQIDFFIYRLQVCLVANGNRSNISDLQTWPQIATEESHFLSQNINFL